MAPPSGGQHLDQFAIRVGKGELAEIASGDPLQFLPQQRPGLARDRRVTEVQAHGALGVGVLGHEEFVADRRVHAEFLDELARKAGVVGLAGLALAAGKLPEAGEVRALETSRDQQLPVALDDGGDHDHG